MKVKKNQNPKSEKKSVQQRELLKKNQAKMMLGILRKKAAE